MSLETGEVWAQSPDELAQHLIEGLRIGWPGIVEEWERQRSDGNEDWPGFTDAEGIYWWLRSEIDIAEGFAKCEDNHVATERALIDYCGEAAEHLRIALNPYGRAD